MYLYDAVIALRAIASSRLARGSDFRYYRTLVYVEGDATIQQYEDAEGKNRTALNIVQRKSETSGPRPHRTMQTDPLSQARSMFSVVPAKLKKTNNGRWFVHEICQTPRLGVSMGTVYR